MSWLLVSVGCLFLSVEVESSVFVLPLESAKDMMTGIGKFASTKILFSASHQSGGNISLSRLIASLIQF